MSQVTIEIFHSYFHLSAGSRYWMKNWIQLLFWYYHRGAPKSKISKPTHSGFRKLFMLDFSLSLSLISFGLVNMIMVCAVYWCHLTAFLIWTVTTSCHLVPPTSKVGMCNFKGINPNYSNILSKQWHLCFSVLHHFWQSGAQSSPVIVNNHLCINWHITDRKKIVCLPQSKW